MSLDIALAVTSAYRDGPEGPGFAKLRQAHRVTPPPACAGAGCTGSSSYGLLVRLRLLPTPHRCNAVTFGYIDRDLLWTGLSPARQCNITDAPQHGSAMTASSAPPPRVWTRSQRYYAGSDSCRARTHPPGLAVSFALPSEYPDPNHIVCLDIALTVTSAYQDRTSKGPRLSRAPASSPHHAAETGSCTYGLLVRLRLLPTPHRCDAVTFEIGRAHV